MSAETAAQVAALLQQWSNGVRARDAASLVSLVVGDVQLVGTGADEVGFGLEGFQSQVERDLGQADDVEMSFSNLRVESFGDAAFAYCELAVSGTAGGQSFALSGLRCTFGLVRTAEGWRFAQMHSSAPAGGQEPGNSYW